MLYAVPTILTRTIDPEVVGTSPVRSNLNTPQLALSTSVRNRVSREATVEEQLGDICEDGTRREGKGSR